MTLWLFRSLRSFLYRSLYSGHVFLISSASVLYSTHDSPSVFYLWLNYFKIKIYLHIIFFFSFSSPFLFFFFGGFCHTLTWISHGFTCVPHPDSPSHLPPHPIPLGLPSAPAPSTCHASSLGWWSVSSLIVYLFQCCSLRSSHPCLLPQSPKVCSVHLCIFFCFAYRVIVTIFLNSIYMH